MQTQKKRHQSGFTIIELMMVVAITSLMFTVAIFGQGAVRGRAQFTDAIESLETELEGAKTEAASGVNVTDYSGGLNNGGSTPNTVLFGAMVVFDPNDSAYKTYILSHGDDQVISTAMVEQVDEKTTRWGVEFRGVRNFTYDLASPAQVRTTCLIFYRDLATGSLKSAVLSARNSISECRDDYDASTNRSVDLRILQSKTSSTNTTYHNNQPKLEFSDSNRTADMHIDTTSSTGSIEVVQR